MSAAAVVIPDSGPCVGERPATLVRYRMTRFPVVVNLDTPRGSVEHTLAAHQISCVPVIDNGRLVGVVTLTDLVRSPAGPAEPARDLMSSPVAIAHPDERIEEAAYRMTALRVHRLIVVDDQEHVLGVLSAHDLLPEVMGRRNDAPLTTIMHAPVETVSSDDTIDDALARLASANVHGLVVVEGTNPIGVFTQQEALSSRRLGGHLRAQPVEDVMSPETLCLDSMTSVRRAAAFCVAMSARRVLVTESRHVVGIATPFDLVAAFVATTS